VIHHTDTIVTDCRFVSHPSPFARNIIGDRNSIAFPMVIGRRSAFL